MRKAKAPPEPPLKPLGALPVTATIPTAGKLFYGASREKSYRMARGENPAIPTIAVGAKLKLALMHVLARRLGVDPLAGS